MNPTQEPQAAAPEVKTALNDKELFAQMLDQAEQDNPYGRGKYTDEDAESLGLPSLGSMRLARQMVKDWYHTPVMPAWIKNSPNPAGTFVATVVRGRELGFKMLEAIASMYLSPDGRLGLYGTAMLALMRRSGIHLEFSDIEEDGKVIGVQVYGKRKDGDEYTARFTRADAQRAGLVKAGGGHEKYPIVLCTWRAASILFRVLASDLAGGPLYSKEELEEEAALEKVIAETERRTSAPPPENPYAPKIKDAPKAGGPQADSTPEAREVQVEGPDTSTRAEAGSSAPAQQAGESGGAVAAALPKSDAGEGATPQVMTATAAPETEKLKVTPISKPKQDPRVPALLAEIEKALPVKQRKKIAEDYLRGYFNVTDVKPVMQDPRMFDAATMLLALCGDWRVQLIGDPHKYGVAAKLGWDKLTEFIKDWPEDSQKLARAMALQYADTGGEGLYDYFAALDLDKADPENLDAFLKVVWRIGIGKSASALWDCGVPVNQVVESWGLDLAASEPAEIVARIGDLEVVPEEIAAGHEGDDEPMLTLFERGGSEDLGK